MQFAQTEALALRPGSSGVQATMQQSLQILAHGLQSLEAQLAHHNAFSLRQNRDNLTPGGSVLKGKWGAFDLKGNRASETQCKVAGWNHLANTGDGGTVGSGRAEFLTEGQQTMIWLN
ncbi:hypothetical protein [Limnohabitans sp. Rim8]|uniref:hypothetical protein n=1 Tax=Limnohabitans sp. Rim8 TaxID=1100718 RepID=UPI00330646DB